jgi:hypothetical protein
MYEIDLPLWRAIYASFLACQRACTEEMTVCHEECRVGLTKDGYRLKDGVTLAAVNGCFNGCDEANDGCLRRCNAKYQMQIASNGKRVDIPGPPNPLDPVVSLFKGSAGKQTLGRLSSSAGTSGPPLVLAAVLLNTFLGPEAKNIYPTPTSLSDDEWVSAGQQAMKNLAVGLAIIGMVQTLLSQAVERIRVDPPDPLYRDPWALRTSALAALDGVRMNPAVAPILRPAFEATVAEMIYAEAVAASLERAVAAKAADDTTAARSQIAVSQVYASFCADALRDGNSARARLTSGLDERIRTFRVPRAEALALQARWRDSGIRGTLRTCLRRLTAGGLVSEHDLIATLVSADIKDAPFDKPLSSWLNPTRLRNAEAAAGTLFDSYATG